MKTKINFKTMLATIGLLIIVVPTAVSVVACSNKQIVHNNDQIVINEINSIPYQIDVLINSKASDLENKITANFIKKQLSENIKSIFDNDKFMLNKVFNEKGLQLSDIDLISTKIINATINYDYGTIKKQTTNLTINVSVSDQQIVDAINQVTYSKAVEINSEAAALKTAITPEFINSQLSGEIKKSFKSGAFKLQQISNDKGAELSDRDLAVAGSIMTKINYDYGVIKKQTTNLTINVSVSDQQIVDAINKITYSTAVELNSKANDLKAAITPEFINSQLSGEIKKAFKSGAFKLKQIINDEGAELSDRDLVVARTVQAKINYNYGEINNQTTNLSINVSVSDQQIADAINQVTYSKAVEINSEAAALKAAITPEFIKSQLSGEIKKALKSGAFQLKQIINDKGAELSDRDLAIAGSIMTKINYDYGVIKNQTTNLTINISVSDQQIVDAINQVTYSKAVELNSKANDLKAEITPEFIKSQLSEEIKKAFKSGAFSLQQIINDKGTELSDRDLVVARTVQAKINYDYGVIKNQTTNLTININMDKRISLIDKFKDFHFIDELNIEDFLNANNWTLMTTQIVKHINATSLNEVGLILDKNTKTSNSIVLKATRDSRIYQGEVTLTWNLKLLEIWGKETITNHPNPYLQKGLVGYFYLEKTTNLIKYFDAYGALTNTSREIDSDFHGKHALHFVIDAKPPSSFYIPGNLLTNEISRKFKSRAWKNSIFVSIKSLKSSQIKRFDIATGNWIGVADGTIINLEAIINNTTN